MSNGVGGWIDSSGPVSFDDLRKQWGYTQSSVPINQYYRGGGKVPGTVLPNSSGQYSSIPSSGQIGMNQFRNHKIARIIRKNHQGPTNDNNRETYSLNHQALYLDLTGWSTSQNVSVNFQQRVDNSGNFIRMYLYGPVNGSGSSTPFNGGYAIRGQSDIEYGYGGTQWVEFNENQSNNTYSVKGGYYYMFRSRDDSARSSGIYCGGENQGGGAGTASGGRNYITVHDAGSCCGDNNTGGNADFAAEVYITGWS